jgi:hypothetical protein
MMLRCTPHGLQEPAPSEGHAVSPTGRAVPRSAYESSCAAFVPRYQRNRAS